MKTAAFIFTLLAFILFSSCSENAKHIQFKAVDKDSIGFAADSSFAMPSDKIWSVIKELKDSCTSNNYDANAVFLRTKDTFHTGDVFNRNTMKFVCSVPQNFLSYQNFFSFINVVTLPCPEKQSLPASVDDALDHFLIFSIDSANENINRQLNAAIHESDTREIETSSWLNLELTDNFVQELDTTSDPAMLTYKKAVFDKDNIVLMKNSSITVISLYVHLKQPLPADIQKLFIKNECGVSLKHLNSGRLILLNDNTIEISFNGFFQLTGLFMRAY